MSYSPFGLGDNRLCPSYDDFGRRCLLSDKVLADVKLISTFKNRIETYSLLCEVAMDAFLAYCVKESIDVMLGVSVSNNRRKTKPN